jgi:hypothetical protein
MLNALPATRLRALAGALAALTLTSVAALTETADARALRAGAASDASTSVSIGGGAIAGKPKKGRRQVPGTKARLDRNGLAIPPVAAPARVRAAIRAGNRIAKKPYKYGGGHGVLNDSGYDCSGSVSYALRRAQLMTSSLASSGFMSWGRHGRGRWITVRANAGHAYMVIAGLRFDTSAGKRTGTRWSAQMRSPRGYVATHPPGL